ncbi:histone acetyltransferase type B catalytic subunit [Olea europaea subsp. europaea]|uniref:Histone acetyltransferase type B catalytic subunit n=1 Tax=Olea europaea subsp. europaea TaxID=158383 RepID=A0A8S0UDU3_OLEEU|nr:histone acetyltransferase type B catalytic subunit [Olea europaea subsp. europaea]
MMQTTISVSSISFLAYADISFESTSDGDKGITDLKSYLQNIIAENLVEKKEGFLQTFSTECDFVKSIASGAKVLQKNASNGSNGDSSRSKAADVEVVGMPVGHLYSRLVPLVLLMDGSNPIDVTDPRWEIYLLVRKDQKDKSFSILVIPPFQREGYGRHLLEVLYNVAISDNVYDLTVEEKVDSLQHVRTCIAVERLLSFEPIQHALNAVVSKLSHENLSKKSQPIQFGPPTSVIEDARKILKINNRFYSVGRFSSTSV